MALAIAVHVSSPTPSFNAQSNFPSKKLALRMATDALATFHRSPRHPHGKPPNHHSSTAKHIRILNHLKLKRMIRISELQ
jgi:hypothetical protein